MSEILSKYIQLSLVKYEKVSQEQIDSIGAEMDAKAAWYNDYKKINGEEMAAQVLKASCEGFLPDNFWMPTNIAFSVDEMSAAREAGALVCRFWCFAINKELGYDKKKLTKVLDGANKIYKSDDLTAEV